VDVEAEEDHQCDDEHGRARGGGPPTGAQEPSGHSDRHDDDRRTRDEADHQRDEPVAVVATDPRGSITTDQWHRPDLTEHGDASRTRELRHAADEGDDADHRGRQHDGPWTMFEQITSVVQQSGCVVHSWHW
jgi:hypothetical protein